MEDKRFNGEQLRNDDYNDNYYEDTSSADNAEALEHDMEYNDISSDFKEESAQSFDQTISNEEPAYSGHSAKAPEVVYHSGGDQVYSYKKYKAQFSAQEHSPKSAAKKKSGSGKKAALIACSLALAMGLGFGGGILGASLVRPGTETTVVTKSSESKTVEATKSNGEKSDLKIVESSNQTKTGGNSIQDVVKQVKDSVVEITTESTSYSSFYGQYVVQGAGSGVIISEDGYIITNHHVIEDASDITVTLTDGNDYKAKVIGYDETLDIALLKIEASGLTVAAFGSSADLEVGETAIVIGNPLGKLGGSVTAGIISSTKRNVKIDGQYKELLQTDAAINPGNSGGGLFDSNGNLVGIIVAKSLQTSSGENVESIGYAIPIDNVKNILGDLKSTGYVTGRPFIGIKPVNVTESNKAQYGVEKEGVYIYTVYEGTAAEQAGLVVGDLILKFDGTDIKTSADLTTAVQKKKSGDKVQMVIYRDGEEKTIEITLGESVPETTNDKRNSNGFNANGSNGSGNSNGSRNGYDYGYGYDYSGRGNNGSYGDIFDYIFN